MKHAGILSFILVAAAWAPSASACDPDSGERTQSAHLSWNGTYVKHWDVSSPEIEKVALENGFKLGIRIEPASAETYAEWKLKHVPELVKISLYDLSGSEPELLTYTWGGANSRQGYGASGGADRVEVLGDPGILLTLLKPVCVSSDKP
jgi:hypothetical protein